MLTRNRARPGSAYDRSEEPSRLSCSAGTGFVPIRSSAISTVCAGDYVGLEEIDDGVWNVYFGPLKLGRFLERHRRIEDAYGRLLRSQ